MEILTHRGAFTQEGDFFTLRHLLGICLKYAPYSKTMDAKLRPTRDAVALCLGIKD